MEEKEYEIPVEGSLGLLALGYAGLLLWREKRAAYEKEFGRYENFFLIDKPNINQTGLDEYLEKTS